MNKSRRGVVYPELQSSLSSFSSDIEVLLKDLIKDKKGFCYDIALTEKGKQKQLIKMLSLILLPSVLLFGIVIYDIQSRVSERSALLKNLNNVELIDEIGHLMNALEDERNAATDEHILGGQNRTSIGDLWQQTDKKFESLSSKWSDTKDLNGFSKIRMLQQHFTRRRKYLISENAVYSDYRFYKIIVDRLLIILQKAVIDAGEGAIWQPLVSFQKLFASQNEASAERAMGVYFFLNGEFETHQNYTFYMRVLLGAKVFFYGAEMYSPQVHFLVNSSDTTRRRIGESVNLMRHAISYQQTNSSSVEMAKKWLRVMGNYTESLASMGRDLIVIANTYLGQKLDSVEKSLVFSCVIGILLIVNTPITVKLVSKVVNDMLRYVITLADKTKELKQEKKKSDSLLQEMLPKMIVETLKQQKDVDAEYFKSVTVMFTAIVDFDKLSTKLSPIQSVSLLGHIYSKLDQIIANYDAYKVETVGSKYMVTSGLPRFNKNHAVETAVAALDILEAFESFWSPVGKIWLQIGINSGPCVAGVIGSTLPRYCVFGDTVNTASRVEGSGLPNRVHISASTQRLLKKSGKFDIISRGRVYLKGKGEIDTFWLVGFKKASVINPLQELLTMVQVHSGGRSRGSVVRNLPPLPEVD